MGLYAAGRHTMSSPLPQLWLATKSGPATTPKTPVVCPVRVATHSADASPVSAHTFTLLS